LCKKALSMEIVIGLDIGGTKLLVAAATVEGVILRRLQQPTPLELDAGLALLHQMIGEVAGGDPVVAIGAAAGGPLDWVEGVVSPLHQPQWQAVPLKQIMEQAYSCPFAVDVDTNVAALGEYWFGGEHIEQLVYLTVSTGMGGGYVIDGQIVRGAGGAHPEMGHQSIPYRCAHPERIQCACGGIDCLEALVSGRGIERIYRKGAAQLTSEEWAEVAYNLGQGLRNIATITLPSAIVLGGGVAVGGGPAFIAEARRVMESGLRLVPHPVVRLSSLGYDTALYGTIALAIQAARR
jgi:glucokinase